jgi:hypothetical protein
VTMALSRWLILFATILSLWGCGDINLTSDLLPFDGFGGSFALGPFRDYVQKLPVRRVARAVTCELATYLDYQQRYQAWARKYKMASPLDLQLDPNAALALRSST